MSLSCGTTEVVPFQNRFMRPPLEPVRDFPGARLRVLTFAALQPRGRATGRAVGKSLSFCEPDCGGRFSFSGVGSGAGSRAGFRAKDRAGFRAKDRAGSGARSRASGRARRTSRHDARRPSAPRPAAALSGRADGWPGDRAGPRRRPPLAERSSASARPGAGCPSAGSIAGSSQPGPRTRRTANRSCRRDARCSAWDACWSAPRRCAGPRRQSQSRSGPARRDADGENAEDLWTEWPSSTHRPQYPLDIVDETGRQPHMKGKQVFKSAVTRMPEGDGGAGAKWRNADDMKMLIPHQANLRINEYVARMLGLGRGSRLQQHPALRQYHRRLDSAGARRLSPGGAAARRATWSVWRPLAPASPGARR